MTVKLLVGGTYNSHDGEGPFQEHVLKHHPVTEGVPDTFSVIDETYHSVADPAGPGVDVLVEANRGGAKHASVWITHNPKARIVCIALGHDGNSHNNPEFKKLIFAGAVTWAAGKMELKMPIWQQHWHDPLEIGRYQRNVAAIPVVVLLAAIAIWHVRIHIAAIRAGLILAWLIAVAVYRMPAGSATAAAIFGCVYGLFPIGWIILNLIFLYDLTVQKGTFLALRGSLASLAPDPRVQVILIAFALGAFFEGAAGFGTPVAITSAILIQLGFRPLMASGLSLIANTAPVAFGALGTPVVTLSGVTGIDIYKLSSDGRRTIAPVFDTRSVLGRLGDGRFSRHDRSLACRTGCRRFFRGSAIPHRTLFWTVARRHCRLSCLHRCNCASAQNLASKDNLET